MDIDTSALGCECLARIEVKIVMLSVINIFESNQLYIYIYIYIYAYIYAYIVSFEIILMDMLANALIYIHITWLLHLPWCAISVCKRRQINDAFRASANTAL